MSPCSKQMIGVDSSTGSNGGGSMKTKKDIEALAIEYTKEGNQKLDSNELEHAVLLVQKALDLFKQVGNLKMYARTLNLMGVIYATIGNETMAVDYYLEGLDYATANEYEDIIPLFYNNIGARYQELMEHEKAISYFSLAENALQKEACKADERYENWCLVTFINLSSSYTTLKKSALAEKYLNLVFEYMKDEFVPDYYLAYLVTKMRLYWQDGKKDFVYQHVDELVEEAINNKNFADYVENISEVCMLLKGMKEYDKWKRVIDSFDEFAINQGSVYCKLLLTEFLMDYYQCTSQNEKYIDLCVEHAALYKQQKIIADRERAAAIDIKIELQAKEVERKNAEIKSNTDSLTGLGNRYMLEKDILVLLEDAIQNKRPIAVGIIDLDCFKQKNDTYGHIKGDECLVQVSDILRGVVADIGKAYRFGGDEFVILLNNGTHNQVETMAINAKQKLHEAGIENINSTVIPEITFSQGYVTIYPTRIYTSEELLQYADKALYHVKENGRNDYLILEEEE